MCVAAAFLFASQLSNGQSVVFINPGKADEAYWVSAANAMQKAADSLDMQLRVIYTHRNRLEPIAIAQQLARLPVKERPDYVIFSNEYNVAPSILRALDGSGIKVFMAFSGGQVNSHEQIGKPRGIYKFWLGSMEPNAEDAGYLTAKALIQAASKLPHLRNESGKLQMLAIAGDRSTTSSIARNQGMHKAVQEAAGQVELLQEVYGEWRKEKAREQADVLFRRYPQARLVWSGNDLMAFGAMDAWQVQGGVPGKDALFSGVNTSAEAFEKLRSGQLTALAGGHFLTGAWAMVMLYDYHRGIDFINEGLEQRRPMFALFDARSSVQFEKRFGAAGSELDFRRYSKYLNPQLRSYDFDLAKLLP
ncbi:MAG TPA: ABC transporter substrate-binding protein [Comamonas sp.]